MSNPALGHAWTLAVAALALHVADEARHDFLSWYNPRALRIRGVLGGLPFPPTFTFLPWLLGLMAAVLLLAALSPAAYAERSWMRPVAGVLAAIHLANGSLHVAGALTEKRAVPGLLTAPLLLATGAYLAWLVWV